MILRALERNNSTSCLPVVPSPAFHPPAHIPICVGGCALATNPHSAPYCGIICFHDPKSILSKRGLYMFARFHGNYQKDNVRGETQSSPEWLRQRQSSRFGRCTQWQWAPYDPKPADLSSQLCAMRRSCCRLKCVIYRPMTLRRWAELFLEVIIFYLRISKA